MSDTELLPDEHPEGSSQGDMTHPVAGEQKRRWWPWLLALIVLCAVAFGVFSGIRKSNKAKAAQVEPPVIPTVRTATAHVGSIGYYVEALGTVTPLATVNLYSQVNGRVVAVHYVEGQMVHRGDPLIDIDPLPYEAQLKESQGTLKKDQSVLAQAELDLTRYKEAADQQAIATQTYDDQKYSVDQDRGTVEYDIGAVEYAQSQLNYCHLVSPITGRVGLRLIDPGNTVFSGSSNALVVVTQLQPVSVVFNVAEDDLGQVRGEILHRAPLKVDVFDRSQLVKLTTGKLITLDNEIDTSTGTIRFRGQFENSDLKLYPNQFVNARLLVKTLPRATLVPTAAVQRNGTQAFVYVISGDTARIRNIDELTTEEGYAAVTGLSAGEMVPITGFDKLQDGAKIKVHPDSDTVGPSSPSVNSHAENSL